MGKIELKAKIITSAEKKLLRFLVEEFLEFGLQDLTARINDAKKVDTYWDELMPFLERNKFWMDEVDLEDMSHNEKREAIINIYGLLKSLWEQFKDGRDNHKNVIIPERKRHKELTEKMDGDDDNEYSQFRGHIYSDVSPLNEVLYDIELHFKVSFEAGRVDFFRRNINSISEFLGFLDKLDHNSTFSRCKNCDKFIVITRIGKEFCSSGCAAKKNQKDKWKDDPEKMREEEKKRYREKRKRSK